MLTVREIYETIDTFAPFESQASWDNSGLLVGCMEMPAQRILTTLDISRPVLAAAKAQDIQLIVAHHPVIFSPLKSLPADSPVYQLAASGIAAICVHTPLDMAPEGLWGDAYHQLKEPLALAENPAVLEPCWQDGRGFGWIADSRRTWTPAELAQTLEAAGGFSGIRYSAWEHSIRRIGYCSGSAASMLELAADKGCDALITGDIKHDRWYAAEYLGVSLFDCGHYGTEQVAAEILCRKIQAAHPTAQVICMPGDDPAPVYRGGDRP